MEKKVSNIIHIVHIIPSLTFGGAERFVVDLASHGSAGFRYSIVVFSNDIPLAQGLSPAVSVHVVEKKRSHLPVFVDMLATRLRTLKPDIIHTHLFSADLWGRLAAKKIRVPVVTTEHNENIAEGWIEEKVKRLFRNKSNVYTCPSTAVQAYMENHYHVLGKDVRVIRHGIDTERFARVPSSEWKDPLRFLMLGRLVHQKGHDIALAAFAELKQSQWKLDIVGNGPLHDTIWRQIARLGLSDRVRLLPATADVSSVLATHDALLMPSRWEGLGLVAMEAMAAERLVIASRTGGIPSMIQDGDNGLLVPPGDPALLRRRIRWSLEHPAATERIAHHARKYAKEHFDIRDMVRAYEVVYLSVVG